MRIKKKKTASKRRWSRRSAWGTTSCAKPAKKAELLLRDAEIKAQNIKETASKQIEAEIEDLRRVRQQASDFKAQLLTLYKAHLEQIQLLPEVPQEEKQPEPQPQPAEPEQPAPQPTEPEEKDVKVYREAEPVTVPLTIPAEPVQVVPPLMAEPEPENDPAVKNRFSDIRFGTEYDRHMDAEEERRGFFKRKK